MYWKSAIVILCKPTLTFWELCTTLTKEMYKIVYYTVICIQLLNGEGGEEHVEKYYIVLNVKC
jgi:hypothetical protein